MGKTTPKINREEWPGHTTGVFVSNLKMGTKVALRCKECGRPILSRSWRKRNLCLSCNGRMSAHEKLMKQHAKK